MKKYLTLFAAAMGLLVASSCSNDDSASLTAQQQMVEQFGTKSSQVGIQIGGVVFRETRGCDVNGNMWPANAVPDPVKDQAVIDDVMAWLQTKPEGVQWPGWTYYYIQHFAGAHHKYEYIDGNGAKHENIDGTASQEYFQVLENNGNWQHAYNFNAGKCDNSATKNAALMTNGLNDVKTLNEYASNDITSWRLFYYKGEFYLGIDYSQKKGDDKIDPDGVYDDWVVKIIPGAGEELPEYAKPQEDPDDDPSDDPSGDPSDDPSDDPELPSVPHVEFDIHQQKHTDWNEVKTSIHLRDTVDVRVFIPIEKDYQAVPDDFDIRTGVDYVYIKEIINSKIQVAGNEYDVEVVVNHIEDGIEILINGSECAAALRDARGVYGDGITFEVHSYFDPKATPAFIWNKIKNTKCVETSKGKWPSAGQCVTYTFGQVTSAYTEERFDYVKTPE